MWNGRCVEEENDGEHFVHDFDSYYKCESKNAPRLEDGRHSYEECVSASGTCNPKCDLSKYPFDPYYRPMAPRTKLMKTKPPLSELDMKCQLQYGCNNDYDDQFKSFKAPYKSNASKCYDDDFRPLLPQPFCQPDCHSPKHRPKEESELYRNRTHFCPETNTEANRNKRYSIIPSWWPSSN